MPAKVASSEEEEFELAIARWKKVHGTPKAIAEAKRRIKSTVDRIRACSNIPPEIWNLRITI